MNEQSKDYSARTFEDLLNSTLEPNSQVYLSPWVGKTKSESVINHEEVETVIMALTEDDDVEYVDGDPKFKSHSSKFVEHYTRDFDNVAGVQSMRKYLDHGGEPLDGMFLAPPGSYSPEERLNKDNVQRLITSWASLSDQIVENGFIFYSDNMWDDNRPLSMDIEDIHQEFDIAHLSNDKNLSIEGRDYSGFLTIQ